MDIPYLEDKLKTKIALVSSRKGTGIEELKQLITSYKTITTEPCLNASSIDEVYFNNLRKTFPNQSLYKLWLVITQDVNFVNLNRTVLENNSFTKSNSELKRLQQKTFAVKLINCLLTEYLATLFSFLYCLGFFNPFLNGQKSLWISLIVPLPI